MIHLPVVDETVKNKRVLVRGDIDVPVSRSAGERVSRIEDDTRLKDIWPTMEYLLRQNCTVLLAGHLGRPEGKVVPELSTKPIQEWVSRSVGQQVRVLENLRFDPREEANDEGYAKELASLADIYINEAFAASERAHASIVGVPKFLPHYTGFRLTKEVEVLSKVLENPQRPLVVIIGGAKLETKIPLVTKMADFADAVIVGGRLLEDDLEKIRSFPKIESFLKLELTKGGNDNALESVEKLPEIIANAKTIIWNGPVGKIEEIDYQAGTKKLAELITSNTSAYKVVGGGDTVGFVNRLGLTDKFDWVSSGGGSMLKLLAGETLPGVEALVS